MSSDPPPPYPGGPTAPLVEEKNGKPPVSGAVPVMTAPSLGHPMPPHEHPVSPHGHPVSPHGHAAPPLGHPLPPEYAPPPYETTMQPGYVPPHVPGEGAMPMPMPMPHPHAGYYPPPGHFPQPIPGQYGPVPSHYASPVGHTATVLAPPGGATTVTVLQGEMFQSAPVQTVCPHCQQAIITRITHDVGLMNTLFCLFCCFVGCDLGCCLLPCLIDDLKDVTHTCPNCKGYIYTYKRMC